MVHNSHDDYDEVRLAYEKARAKPHWQWNEYDMDDIASYHMIEGLKAMNEKRRWRNRLAAGYRVLFGNPSRSRTKPLGDILREIGLVVTDEWRRPH
jgi:hypothetical protein